MLKKFSVTFHNKLVRLPLKKTSFLYLQANRNINSSSTQMVSYCQARSKVSSSDKRTSLLSQPSVCVEQHLCSLVFQSWLLSLLQTLDQIRQKVFDTDSYKHTSLFPQDTGYTFYSSGPFRETGRMIKTALRRKILGIRRESDILAL